MRKHFYQYFVFLFVIFLIGLRLFFLLNEKDKDRNGMIFDELVFTKAVVVSEAKNHRNSISYILKNVSVNGFNTSQPFLLFRSRFDEELFFADQISFKCRWKKPEFESSSFIATCFIADDLFVEESQKNVWEKIRRTLFVFKKNSIEQIQKYLHEPYASFGLGLIFGGDYGLSEKVKNDFQKTGLSHILAASGFNVSLFSLYFYFFLRKFFVQKKIAVLLMGLFLIFYLLLIGFQVSIIRATCFGILLLFGEWIGRRVHFGRMFFLIFFLMLLQNPFFILTDLGFIFSFLSTAVLLFLYPKVEDRFVFIPEAFGLRSAFLGSLLITIISSPLVYLYFKTFSFVAPISNLIVLPFIPILTFLMLVILLGSYSFSFLSLFFSFLFTFMTQFLFWIIHSVSLFGIFWLMIFLFFILFLFYARKTHLSKK